MKKTSFHIALFFLLVGGAALAQEDPLLTPLETVDIAPSPITSLVESDAEILDNVQVYLNSIKSLKAQFSQQGPDGRIAIGTLHLERPGKVRFEYEAGVPLLIVSDGNTLNMIDYDIGQVTKWPVNDTPLALLLAENVTFNNNTTVTSRKNEIGAGYISITSSNPENPQQGSLILVFSQSDNSDLELRAWQVVDAQGKLTTVSIANMELNNGLDRALWTFDDPRGDRLTRNRRR